MCVHVCMLSGRGLWEYRDEGRLSKVISGLVSTVVRMPGIGRQQKIDSDSFLINYIAMRATTAPHAEAETHNEVWRPDRLKKTQTV